MSSSMPALPPAVLRAGRLVRQLALGAFTGAVTLIKRAVRRGDEEPPSANATRRGSGPAASAAWSAERSSPERVAPAVSAPRLAPVADPAPRPVPVVDPVPLAEPAVDLDVHVTLASELAIPSYDALAAKDAASAIRKLTDAEEVRAVLAFEEENGKRSTVLTPARRHLAALERSVRP